MPSRLVTLLIVTAWVATLGWFGHRELWPLLFPGDAPPFVIELADEVSSEFAGGGIKRPDVLWGVYRGDKRIGRAETRLRYFREDNTFEMETRVVNLQLVAVEIPEMFNAYRINRQGELRAQRVSGSMKVALPVLNLTFTVKVSFFGEVRGDKLYRTGTLEIPVFGKVEPKLEPVDAPRGSVLNPMHPVPKIKNLQPGRRWRMPIIDPLSDAVEPALKAVLEKIHPGQQMDFKKLLPEGPKFVDAEVLTETAEVMYNGESHRCRVIEYRGEDGPAHTYVRISDGAVLRQEAFARGEKIVLQRE